MDFNQFVEGIVASGLLSRERLDEVRARLAEAVSTEVVGAQNPNTTDEPKMIDGLAPPQNEIESLARELIRSKLLTKYQVGRILQGRHKGLILGNNILLEKIGEGGMGRVYRAQHQKMKRIVAVKVLNELAMQSTQYVQRFQREVQTAAQLNHPHIVTAYDAGEQDGQLFLVMEYVKGRDLLSIVKRDGPLELGVAINYIIQAAEGLHYAHSQSVIHRDVKPSNLLVNSEGVVKILDLGLARSEATLETFQAADQESLTRDHHILGTVEYMSPEQSDNAGSIDHRADIYSLGCTLYFILTGTSPFSRQTALKTIVAHQVDPIPQLRDKRMDAPLALERVFAKMVAKNPEDRYQSMGHVVEDLSTLARDSEFELVDAIDELADSNTKTFAFGELEANQARSENPIPGVGTEGNSGFALGGLKDFAVGIDLGTTFSAIAYVDQLGRPVTLSNAEGEKITPSVLLIDGDDIIVGKEAVKAMGTDMESVAECAKRQVGLPEFDKVLDGKVYRPEVLQAYILRKLKRDAEAQIGVIRRAVITVPAYFDETRRKATQDAGYLAGLEVMDIINEPTAAAVAYGYHHSLLQDQSSQSRDFVSRPQNVLVYDLGGGTFDVTVMRIHNQQYRTLATDGDVQLGGRDWDERLVEAVAEQFFTQFNEDPRMDPNALGRLLRECEDAKRTLSARSKATIACDYRGHALRLSVTREQFEKLTSDLLGRTEFTTKQTLKSANLSWQQVDRILMVGGSTRMPAVSSMLQRLSGIKPDQSVAPDEAIAHGAAIRAGMLLLREQGETLKFDITNVNSHSLGVVGRNPKTGVKQTAILIPRNTALPAIAERVFRTHKFDQRSILVQLVEGENSNPDDCAKIGKCIVHNLPPKLPQKTPIKVQFRYNENGRLTVWVKVSGLELKQQILRENSLSSDEMKAWRDAICQA
jgi:molecular chaperone DnaK